MDFIEYILCSEPKNKFYVRFASDLPKRITRHNQKSADFTMY